MPETYPIDPENLGELRAMYAALQGARSAVEAANQAALRYEAGLRTLVDAVRRSLRAPREYVPDLDRGALVEAHQ